MNKEYQQIDEWFSVNGDLIHNLNHELNENSVVFDIGGYTGRWASQIYEKFKCNIYIIEPIKEFYTQLENKFITNKNIHYKQVGIGTKNENYMVKSINSDATRLVKDSTGNISIDLKTLEDLMSEFKINNIDLLQINIEGAEYDILENWIDTKIIEKIKTIQIQFHNFQEIPNYIDRRDNIRNNLLKLGFKEKFNYQWVWECWTK